MKKANHSRIVIIGAGPTGLGAAYRLTELGYNDFVVFERNAYVGGLSASFYDEKGFTWDFAVHVAHSHYRYVDELMDSLLPDGFYQHQRQSWIREYDSWIPYPFQYNFRHLPPIPREECLQGLLQLHSLKPASGGKERIPTARNFKDWMLQGFGPGITHHFMYPYNRKNWSIDPSLMGVQWLGDRVPVVDIERVQRNLSANTDDVEWGPNHVFKFPRYGGTGSVWRQIAARLPEGRLKLSSEVVAVDSDLRSVRLADGSIMEYDTLISTAPLPHLAKWMQSAFLQNAVAKLKHNHIYVVGLALELPDHRFIEDKSWIYCPEEGHVFYRVTPFSNFSPAHVPDSTRHISFLCEISRPGEEAVQDPACFIEATIRDLKKAGLLPSETGPIHVYPMTAEFGYPIPTQDRDEVLHEVMPHLESRSIFSRGRFGGWKYEVSNMDHSIMQGVEAVNRIMGLGNEVTWAHPSRVNAGKN